MRKRFRTLDLAFGGPVLVCDGFQDGLSLSSQHKQSKTQQEGLSPRKDLNLGLQLPMPTVPGRYVKSQLDSGSACWRCRNVLLPCQKYLPLFRLKMCVPS